MTAPLAGAQTTPEEKDCKAERGQAQQQLHVEMVQDLLEEQERKEHVTKPQTLKPKP